MFALILVAVVGLIMLRVVLSNPLVLLLAVGVFCYFYCVVPSQDPSAPRFGELTPSQEPAPHAQHVKVRRALPVVRKALPVTTTLPDDRR